MTQKQSNSESSSQDSSTPSTTPLLLTTTESIPDGIPKVSAVSAVSSISSENQEPTPDPRVIMIQYLRDGLLRNRIAYSPPVFSKTNTEPRNLYALVVPNNLSDNSRPLVANSAKIANVANFATHPTIDALLTQQASREDDALISARNGYERLAEIGQDIAQTQTLLHRGMRAANSSVANAYYSGTSKLLGLVGINYQAPDLRETVSLQLQQMREYSTCINEIIAQTQSELRTTHAYVFTLGNELHKLHTTKESLAQKMSTISPAGSLQQMQRAIESPNIQDLDAFLQTHDEKMGAILAQGEHSVAQRATTRKKEYLRHAYATELLLIGSLTTAKKIAVDTCSYASMLSRLSSSYFTLGCSSNQLNDILGGLESMQRFTDSMQTSVAGALQRLDGAILTRRTSVGNVLERAVYRQKS